jgi:DNA-binding transcriptional MocR family regulator
VDLVKWTNLQEKPVQLPALDEALGDWRARPGPLYLRLGEALADALSYGLFSAQTRLPSEREAATYLKVSRATVGRAYELAASRGLVETRLGSGTYLLAGSTAAGIRQVSLLSGLARERAVPIDLSVAAPQPQQLPEITVDLAAAGRLLPPHGYAPAGAPALRQAIAEHLANHRGVPSRAGEVLVTQGGQGALTMLGGAFLKPGDRVILEEPTYPGAIEVFSRAGAELVAIERDEAGIRPDRLAEALQSAPARLLYLVPTCHNPTGSVMSEARRREVLSITAERGLPILEDTVMADLLFSGPPPTDLAAMDPTRTISIGSLSKSVWGGLRVGWIRAPRETVLRLSRLRAALDLGSPALAQAGALAALADFDSLLAASRAQAQERLGVLSEELERQLPDWSYPRPRGGYSLWITLPRGSAGELVARALDHGVAISTGSGAGSIDGFAAQLRLSAGPPPAQIRDGVTRLARAWMELEGDTTRVTPAVELPV